MQEAADPTPGNGQVRIRVAASGVNFADLTGRMGMYGDAPDIPYVPGYEVAGVIDQVAQGVGDWQEGDEVLALTHFGGYSDVVCVPHKQVFRRLAWMPAEDGAALPVNYLTAYMMLVVMGSVRSGDRVLIHGAGGGVGIAALDICNILGAETIGTASAHKHDFLLERGLSHAIDYRERDYEPVVKELTGGKGVQAALDPLGGKHWRKNYRLLAPAGRLVHFGVSSMVGGERRSWRRMLKSLLHLPFYTPIRLMNANKAVIGVNLGRMWQRAAMMGEWMRQIIAWYDEALFRPQVDRIFPFTQAAEAHRYLQARQNVGKVLLVP